VPLAAGTARRRRGGPGAGKQATQARDSPHLGLIGHRLEGGGRSDERARRRPATAAAAARTPTKIGTELHNTWHGQLPCDLVEVLEGLVGPGSKRSLGLGGGCSAAAAGTRAPASGQVGLANTRACGLARCGEKL
jgi:hypothetical protein